MEEPNVDDENQNDIYEDEEEEEDSEKEDEGNNDADQENDSDHPVEGGYFVLNILVCILSNYLWTIFDKDGNLISQFDALGLFEYLTNHVLANNLLLKHFSIRNEYGKIEASGEDIYPQLLNLFPYSFYLKKQCISNLNDLNDIYNNVSNNQLNFIGNNNNSNNDVVT